MADVDPNERVIHSSTQDLPDAVHIKKEEILRIMDILEKDREYIAKLECYVKGMQKISKAQEFLDKYAAKNEVELLRALGESHRRENQASLLLKRVIESKSSNAQSIESNEEWIAIEKDIKDFLTPQNASDTKLSVDNQ